MWTTVKQWEIVTCWYFNKEQWLLSLVPTEIAEKNWKWWFCGKFVKHCFLSIYYNDDTLIYIRIVLLFIHFSCILIVLYTCLFVIVCTWYMYVHIFIGDEEHMFFWFFFWFLVGAYALTWKRMYVNGICCLKISRSRWMYRMTRE